MNVRVYAAIFGVLFLLLGILGYFPQITPAGIDRVFPVNPIYSIFYMITGLVALCASFMSSHASRVYFRIFSGIYLFLALLSFLIGSDLVFMRSNIADRLFHLIIGSVFAYFGYGKPRERDTVVATDLGDRIPREDREAWQEQKEEELRAEEARERREEEREKRNNIRNRDRE